MTPEERDEKLARALSGAGWTGSNRQRRIITDAIREAVEEERTRIRSIVISLSRDFGAGDSHRNVQERMAESILWYITRGRSDGEGQ